MGPEVCIPTSGRLVKLGKQKKGRCVRTELDISYLEIKIEVSLSIVLEIFTVKSEVGETV